MLRFSRAVIDVFGLLRRLEYHPRKDTKPHEEELVLLSVISGSFINRSENNLTANRVPLR